MEIFGHAGSVEYSSMNDLNDFCPLLENPPKKDYKEMMKSYGESQILHNINAIQNIEQIHKKTF